MKSKSIDKNYIISDMINNFNDIYSMFKTIKNSTIYSLANKEDTCYILTSYEIYEKMLYEFLNKLDITELKTNKH